MKTAIILHGMPDKESYFDPKADSPSNCHWLPWLQQQLNIRGILSQTPEMPDPYSPDYGKWKSVFEQFELNENTVLVGHSCGGGFIIRYISENNIKVDKVVLVAPWINSKREEDVTMFDGLRIDQNLVFKTKGVTIFSSSNDDNVIVESVEMLQNTVKGVRVLKLKNYGHFCLKDMKTREFPELLEEIIK